jgi:hypothetical protein
MRPERSCRIGPACERGPGEGTNPLLLGRLNRVEQQAPATSWGLLCPLVGDQRSDEAARRGRDLLEAQFGAGAYLLHFAVSRLHRCESSASVVPADGVSVRHVMGRRPGPGVRNGNGTPVMWAL